MGAGPGTLFDTENTTTDIIACFLPSVVTISVSAQISNRGIMRTLNANVGSGFVISDNGFIATNKHVVDLDEAEYTVIIDEEKYLVKNIYKDSGKDLATIKINAKNLKPLSFGNSTILKLGEPTIAIGTPLGEFTNM